jgi:hypothetical protein
MILVAVSVSLGILSLSAQAMADQTTKALSPCELIEHRTEYNGRIVTVQGEVGGGGHGAWLVASSGCHYKLITQGVEWPNAIYLNYPTNQSRNEANYANFRVDWKAIQRADERVRHSGFNPDRDRVIITYVGRFVTYLDLDKRVSLGVPGALRLGFGPVGLGAPAQLLIKTIRDVSIVHGDTGPRR